MPAKHVQPVCGEHTEHARRYASRVQCASTVHETRGSSNGNMRARPGSDQCAHLAIERSCAELKEALQRKRRDADKGDWPSAVAGGSG